MTTTQLLKATKEFWTAFAILEILFILIVLTGAEPEWIDILAVQGAFIVMCVLYAWLMTREEGK